LLKKSRYQSTRNPANVPNPVLAARLKRSTLEAHTGQWQTIAMEEVKGLAAALIRGE
jgi:hypothetical protein